MQTSSTLIETDGGYISRDDESEAKLLRDIHGVGDVILDDEDVRQYNLADFGMGLGEDLR